MNSGDQVLYLLRGTEAAILAGPFSCVAFLGHEFGTRLKDNQSSLILLCLLVFMRTNGTENATVERVARRNTGQESERAGGSQVVVSSYLSVEGCDPGKKKMLEVIIEQWCQWDSLKNGRLLRWFPKYNGKVSCKFDLAGSPMNSMWKGERSGKQYYVKYWEPD